MQDEGGCDADGGDACGRPEHGGPVERTFLLAGFDREPLLDSTNFIYRARS